MLWKIISGVIKIAPSGFGVRQLARIKAETVWLSIGNTDHKHLVIV